MPEAVRTDDREDARIVLGLLESVERDGEQSQRRLAAELGIALGLVNAYLKRCVSKGLVKVRTVPTRRYAYYLTPQGFAEKSRLTVEYFSSSFAFFRQARSNCSSALTSAAARGWQTVALLGISDLAEIAIICAIETGVTVRFVVDPRSTEASFVGVAVVKSLAQVVGQVDAVVVTDLKSPQSTAEAAVRLLGASRVLVPTLLNLRVGSDMEIAE